VTLAAEPTGRDRAAAGRIEIALPDGVSVAIEEGVPPARLADVLAVLGRAVGRGR